MAHNIETNGSQATFVSAHTAAWHQLGETLDHTFTADEALTHAHLKGWNVRKEQEHVKVGGSWLPVPGRFATLRDNPWGKGVDVIGSVGTAYTPIQNEAHIALLDALVDESGARFETAGSLNGGRQTFVTMKMPDHILVGGVDKVDTYIAAMNSHDGSMKFTLMVTPVRVVCANTMNLAFRNNSHKYTVRHSSGAQKALVGEARQALGMSFKYLENFQEEADRLINTTLTQQAFEAIIVKEFGVDKDAAPAVQRRADEKIDEMAALFATASTQEGIRGTAWAGLNALTEWADHYRPTRGEDGESTRALTAVLDPSFKNRALELMAAV